MKAARLATALVVAALALCQTAQADQLQTMDMFHTRHMAMQAQPTQGGQGAFAAIHEIVLVLVANPHTD